MISDLGLSGNELLVYAVIYGYSQDGESEYYGSLAHLSELLRLDRSTVIRVLQRLVDAQLIRKRVGLVKNIERCFYHACVVDEILTLDRGGRGKMPPVAKYDWGSGKMPPPSNNKIIIKENPLINKGVKEKTAEPLFTPPKNEEKRQKFIKPTVEEIAEYCASRNNGIDAQRFYDYNESVGWMVGPSKKMKDWKAAIRTWEQKDKEKNNNKQNNESNTAGNSRAVRLAEARADILASIEQREREFTARAGLGELFSEELP